MTEAECATAGGIWGGAGSTLESFPCAVDPGLMAIVEDPVTTALRSVLEEDPENLFEEVVPMLAVGSPLPKVMELRPLHTRNDNVLPYNRTRCYTVNNPFQLTFEPGDTVLLCFDINLLTQIPRDAVSHVMPYFISQVYPSAALMAVRPIQIP
jgi:hypothetical protein